MNTTTRPRGVGRKVAHDPGDPLVTSHCPFCGSGQVVGRSDGTIGCDFCGQNYIVRVQPAFPGMPQMPMGPGAPSDVGPDGGLVDPGMIGPDGMPADGGGPPPGDSDPEGGPQDEPPDDDGLPPSGGGSEDDATGSAPPKKGKSKKESARRYLGLEGQVLTEDQFLRHVAVRASGADPRVLAAMRRESARGRRASRRTAVSGYEGGPVEPHEWASRMDDMNRRFAGIGLGNLANTFEKGELGHNMQVALNRDTGHWHARIYHHADNTGSAVKLHLGPDDEQVPDRFLHAMHNRHVVRALGEQYQRAAGNMSPSGVMLSRRPRRREDQPPPHEFDFSG